MGNNRHWSSQMENTTFYSADCQAQFYSALLSGKTTEASLHQWQATDISLHQWQTIDASLHRWQPTDVSLHK